MTSELKIIAATVVVTLIYAAVAAVTNRAVHCAHRMGYGEEPPAGRAIKCAALWPWYVATWVLQWIYMEVTDGTRKK